MSWNSKQFLGMSQNCFGKSKKCLRISMLQADQAGTGKKRKVQEDQFRPRGHGDSAVAHEHRSQYEALRTPGGPKKGLIGNLRLNSKT